jgi:hypothetical protein
MKDVIRVEVVRDNDTNIVMYVEIYYSDGSIDIVHQSKVYTKFI